MRQYRNEEVLPTEYCPSTNTLGLASKSLVVSGLDCHSPTVSCNERPVHHSSYATTSRSGAATAPSIYHTAASTYQCPTNDHTEYVSPQQHEATQAIMHHQPLLLRHTEQAELLEWLNVIVVDLLEPFANHLEQPAMSNSAAIGKPQWSSQL